MNSSPFSKTPLCYCLAAEGLFTATSAKLYWPRCSWQLNFFGQGGVDFGDFASWAARMMCEPVDGGFGGNDDQKKSPSLSSPSSEEADEEGDMDVGGWRRGKSRQYGGGVSAAGATEDPPPPISSARLTPVDEPTERDTASTSWEYRRDESTGIMVRIFARLRIVASSYGWLAHSN